jgi:tetratricopeptide (TPR) repeat protein
MERWRIAVLISVMAVFSIAGRPALAGGVEAWSQANEKAAEGELSQALKLFGLALETGDLASADQAKVYASRGVIWRKKGDLDKALADFSKALALDKGLKEAYLNRGNLWRLKGRPKKAMTDYSKALGLDPEWAPPYHGIAWLIATNRDGQLGSAETALEMARKAISLERNANHLDTLAAAYAKSGMFEEAVKTQEEALALIKDGKGKARRAAFLRRLKSYQAGKPWRE